MSAAIYKWRLFNDQSQKEFAETIGVSPHTLQSWELGRTRPRIGMMRQVAARLGISLESLRNPPPDVMAMEKEKRSHKRTQA